MFTAKTLAGGLAGLSHLIFGPWVEVRIGKRIHAPTLQLGMQPFSLREHKVQQKAV